MANEQYEREVTITFQVRSWLENVSMEQADELVPTGDQLIDYLRDNLSGEWWTEGAGAEWWIDRMTSQTGEVKPRGRLVNLAYGIQVQLLTETEELDEHAEALERILERSIRRVAGTDPGIGLGVIRQAIVTRK